MQKAKKQTPFRGKTKTKKGRLATLAHNRAQTAMSERKSKTTQKHGQKQQPCKPVRLWKHRVTVMSERKNNITQEKWTEAVTL